MSEAGQRAVAGEAGQGAGVNEAGQGAVAPATTAGDPGSLRLVATLFVAGALSGLAIATVFEFTLPMIEANNAEALRRAVFKVVPGSTQVQALVVRDGALAAASGSAADGPVVYGAYDDDGRFVGYAIESSGSGFQDTIGLLYGFDPKRRLVTGLEILASLETPGLGDKIMKDPDFAANFRDLAVDPGVVLVKTGRDGPNEVDAITGATISSKAVVKIVQAGNDQWLSRLPQAGAEPPLAPAGSGDVAEAAPAPGKE